MPGDGLLMAFFIFSGLYNLINGLKKFPAEDSMFPNKYFDVLVPY